MAVGFHVSAYYTGEIAIASKSVFQSEPEFDTLVLQILFVPNHI